MLAPGAPPVSSAITCIESGSPTNPPTDPVVASALYRTAACADDAPANVRAARAAAAAKRGNLRSIFPILIRRGGRSRDAATCFGRWTCPIFERRRRERVPGVYRA